MLQAKGRRRHKMPLGYRVISSVCPSKMFLVRFRVSKTLNKQDLKIYTSSNSHESKGYSSPIFFRHIVVVKEEIWEPKLSGWVDVDSISRRLLYFNIFYYVMYGFLFTMSYDIILCFLYFFLILYDIYLIRYQVFGLLFT
ncbi:hypothetical protein AMTRI_Chr02g260790 [Amborella trichopoda]